MVYIFFEEGDLCLQCLFQLYPFKDKRTQKLKRKKDEMLGLLVATKQHELDLGSGYVGDLGNLLGSVGEGGNSVLAVLYAMSQKFC